MARIYWLTDTVATMPHPLRQSLAAEMVELRSLKLKGFGSLLTENEIKMIGLESEVGLCKELDIRFWHFPVPDAKPPNSTEQAQ